MHVSLDMEEIGVYSVDATHGTKALDNAHTAHSKPCLRRTSADQ